MSTLSDMTPVQRLKYMAVTNAIRGRYLDRLESVVRSTANRGFFRARKILAQAEKGSDALNATFEEEREAFLNARC